MATEVKNSARSQIRNLVQELLIPSPTMESRFLTRASVADALFLLGKLGEITNQHLPKMPVPEAASNPASNPAPEPLAAMAPSLTAKPALTSRSSRTAEAARRALEASRAVASAPAPTRQPAAPPSKPAPARITSSAIAESSTLRDPELIQALLKLRRERQEAATRVPSSRPSTIIRTLDETHSLQRPTANDFLPAQAPAIEAQPKEPSGFRRDSGMVQPVLR